MNRTAKTMNCLFPGECAIVHSITADASMKRRLQDLGLIRGTKILCVCTAAHRDISVYRIRGALIAIRDRDAACVFLE